MPKNQIEALRKRSPQKFEKALERAHRRAREEPPVAAEAGDPERAVETVRRLALEGAPPPEAPSPDLQMASFVEAIVRETMRPAYFISNDLIEIEGDYDEVDLVRRRKQELETLAKGVGRIDLFGHPWRAYAGTGWLVDKDIAITNRHVARIFSERDRFGNLGFAPGRNDEAMRARLDYIRQHRTQDLFRGAFVREILYVANDGEPDIAVLRVETIADLEPLDIDTRRVEGDLPVAAIGYPARDLRNNDPDAFENYYGGVFNVKRFSPGFVMEEHANELWVLSDYTTLGGNSGSPVLDLESGRVVGLHFAGRAAEANYAVPGDILAATLARLRSSATALGGATVEEIPPTEATPPDAFAGRDGYDPNFLGSGELCAPPPSLGKWAEDVAPVSDDDQNILKYRHFSVIQSKSRRLPLLTAVNIDGDKSFVLKRRGSFRIDGRVAREHQVGNELYFRNPLDRGHMVRRRDPGWGETRQEAQEAEIDTFHYTNVAPQHEDLNQEDWLRLEDHILQAAETRDFKANVFTGPVLRDDDRPLRRQRDAEDVAIPREYWKVVVMVNADTRELSATGYVLSQGDMIRDLTEAAFVFGAFETFQVQIALIEKATGLDFGRLKQFDPLGAELQESFGAAARRIAGPQDLELTPRMAGAAAGGD